MLDITKKVRDAFFIDDDKDLFSTLMCLIVPFVFIYSTARHTLCDFGCTQPITTKEQALDDLHEFQTELSGYKPTDAIIVSSVFMDGMQEKRIISRAMFGSSQVYQPFLMPCILMLVAISLLLAWAVTITLIQCRKRWLKLAPAAAGQAQLHLIDPKVIVGLNYYMMIGNLLLLAIGAYGAFGIIEALL